MADNILKARVRHAYKTDAEWANANPILLKGEIAYSSDIRQTKTGDGTAHWADLEYDVAKPAWHEHDLSEMINKLNANGSIPKDNDYYISQYVGGGTTTTTYQRRPMSALWEYIKAKANSLYTRIEDFNLLKNTVTDNTKVVNRVKNGINSIINSDDSISVNPSINGMGYAIHRGGSGCVKFDGFELPIYQDSIEYLFDGKSSTYLRFESIQDYCDIKQIAWDSTKQYKKGDFVVLLNNGNINSYLLFKALSDNTGKNPLENPSIWYDNYRRSTNTYSGCAILRKILIQVEVFLPGTADWETGYSIYFRAAGQTVRDLLVEAGDVNKENWQTEGRISGVCGPVVTIFPNKNMSGKKRSIRLSFYNRNDNTEWTAITQIAITGLVGGLEGTVLNKGGGELYGNVYPHQSNVINLGDSSHKWNAVYANNFKGNADTATKATSATKADSATTATTANKATLASAVENSGTASDGAARHVWFSNSTDETKRASSDNLKYTPNTQMLTTNVSGNAGSATKLQTIRKVDGVNFDGSADITHYGTCSTAAATAAKTVTLNGFNLATGAKVAVKFTVTNTAANPTLNVNGTGAKSIKYRGAAISTDALAANRIYEFIYDGTDYVFVGDINTDTNTTYGNMTGATTSAAGKAGLVPAPAAGTATRYLRSDGSWQVPPDTTYNDATTSTHGLMSTSDKSKLDGIASGANKTTVDSTLSDSSTNPVQNKVVVSALSSKATNTLLTNENLNAITIPGFYNASGGNTCTNKPTNVDEFGLEVIHTAGGNYYVQILYRKNLSYRRTCVNGTWSAWTTDKLTDTTYSDATQSAHGLMSVTDKSKLDGIAVGATKVVVDSALSSTSTNPVQNKVINTALADKADITSASYNTLKANASNTSLVVPDENAIASSPFSRDLWHDHFAFLNSHTIQDSQISTDGTTWTTSTTDLKNLFAQKEYVNTTLLTADIKARRFVLYSNDFSWSSILWYEFGVANTDPFSNFNILIETSADDKKTWTTVANATVESHSNPHFIKGIPFYGNKYLRFTFTKTTNVTTGIVNLTCIKGLTKRKGNQGRGIEYESPYDWNYNRDIYPWVDNVQNLGSSAKKWKNVYATTFTGALSGNASTATKATQDSAGQQINTTYIKGLSASGKTITYTKGDNKTETATISGFVPMEGTTKDNPMTGAIIQSSTDNGHTYLAGYTPSGSRLISSSSSGTRTTELTPSSFTTNLETGDAETSGALDVTFYPQKNKQMIYLGGSSSDWIIRGVGTPVQDGDAVNKNYIDSTLENWSNDLVEELQGLIPVYGTWEDTPVTGNIVFNGKATVTGVKEPSSDSDVATKGYVDRQNSIKSVTLTAAGWTGTTAPYTQAVKVDGITEDDNPVMVSMLAAGATPDTQKAYNKAFGIICSGTGTTANGSVTFSVYSKPATDITVGLKGV